MATKILMPALSPTMTEGKIVRWVKKEGDNVVSGDVLAEIETDKATMDFESTMDGVLGRILVQQGSEGVPVGSPIALMVQKGESLPPISPKAETTKQVTIQLASSHVLPTSPTSLSTTSPTEKKSSSLASAPVSALPVPTPISSLAPLAVGQQGKNRIIASPLARRLAREEGIDLTTLKGSGPHGRIVRRDVDAAKAVTSATISVSNAHEATAALVSQHPTKPSMPLSSVGSSAIVGGCGGGEPYQVIPHTTMRKVIARRLTEAKTTIPHFYVSVDVELDALLALRNQLNALSSEKGEGAFKLSVNDMLIKASAVALKQVPGVNASYTDEAMIVYDHADISIAVALEDGLITPIIRQVELKSLKTISLEAKELIARARAGKLKPEEFQGGTFSITNMGMYGVKSFSAVINPPQSAILAVSAAQQQAVVVHGEVKVATVMEVTLSVDHRAVDGVMAAKWLAAFKAAVQSPMTLVL